MSFVLNASTNSVEGLAVPAGDVTFVPRFHADDSQSVYKPHARGSEALPPVFAGIRCGKFAKAALPQTVCPLSPQSAIGQSENLLYFIWSVFISRLEGRRRSSASSGFIFTAQTCRTWLVFYLFVVV